MKTHILKLSSAGLLMASLFNVSHADIITPSGSTGASTNRVSQDGYIMVGAAGEDTQTGSFYIFDISDPTDNYGEIRITASDRAVNDQFGHSASLKGNHAIVGAIGSNSYTGAVYIYDISDSANNYGEIKLTASDGSKNSNFGSAVSQYGNNVLVGAIRKNSYTGAAYVYDISNSANNYGEIILAASDGATGDYYGQSVSQNGNYALVGAYGKNAAYVYNISDSANNYGEIKLSSSDSSRYDAYGWSVSQSGTIALVGAPDNYGQQGAAYVYDISDSANNYGQIKIRASDGEGYDKFGYSVSQSGNTALVGAQGKKSNTGAAYAGAAYIYDISDSADNYGEIKLTASDGKINTGFGIDVSVDGDNLVIGASKNIVYTGKITSMSTLDDGTSRIINGISFKSQRNWIIGENTSGNKITLSAGDTAEVTYSDKAMYIGKNAGSNNNQLVAHGALIANELIVGGVNNSGNQLYVSSTGDTSGVENIYLHIGSTLFFEDETDLLSTLGSTELHMLDEGTWNVVTAANHDDLIARGILEVIYSAEGMLVRYGNIPEPAEVAAFLGIITLAFASCRRRKYKSGHKQTAFSPR